MRTIGPTANNMQPLPSLPSPTLTNPDMVLPNEIPKFPALPSPPRQVRNQRPPSPSYLKEQSSENMRTRSGSSGSSITPAKREKRGLMSRKMMLLRSRTASSGFGTQLSEAVSPDQDSTYASSPTITDVGNLGPAAPVSRWSSNGESSTDSDDTSALPQLLAMYDSNDLSGTDNELDSTSTVGGNEYAASNFTGNLEAERRQKEEEEQNSAILSKRAEEILANAKKRLNLMEGNLRGARDLVAPLTAANLKRATSVASYVSPTASFGGINRYVQKGYHYDAAGRPYRTLHAQASNPTLTRDYQGHWRGFSETELPERQYTALDGTDGPIAAQGYIPTKANDPLWTKTLKGSRSHDSLGNLAFRRSGSRDPFYSKNSPDPNLEPLVEDEDPTYPEPTRSTSSQADSRDDSSSYRSTSTPDDLQSQMSSLKGRISALKERAREDSIRRQSMQNLRDPSPLNNATATAPELLYASSPIYGSTAGDPNAGLEYTRRESNRDSQSSYQTVWESTQVITGSRNAFAEQAQRMVQRDVGHDAGPGSADARNRRSQESRPVLTHKRTPSGTVVIQSSKHRYSHHQLYHVQDMSGVYGATEPSTQNDEIEIGTAHDSSSRYGDDEDSQATASVYEEAQEEPHQPVLPHEDREDAFDYDKFFLQSAMAIYGNGTRRLSISSEESIDSVSTARGPTAADETFDVDEMYHAESEDYPPSTPRTPEQLRAIERNLIKRTLSDESLSTIATFATATEGRETPEPTSPEPLPAIDWPISPTNSNTPPSTAVLVQQPQIALSDSSSERADSGVALNGNRNSSKSPPTHVPKHKPSLSSSAAATSTLSPPMSPRGTISRDPATIVVNALLAQDGRQLGLRDKALLFGLVESLKKVCQSLQENDETSYDSRMLRRRLDDARRVLTGNSEVRPGTS